MTFPRQLGTYVVEAEIGRGGMGVVYRARDPRLERIVAIKMLPPELSGDPEFLTRFEREARILASLHHPGIAGIHALEDVGRARFLALEYVEGPTLAERLAQRPMRVDEAVDIACQIAVAIEAAHETGVIHRDLKPGNIKITPGGEVKVLDFGLARFETPRDGNAFHSQSPGSSAPGTQLGVILGTAGYMSPEQARGQVLDRRTDIWSFGCILYECLTGKQAFAGETVSDSIARILEREPDLSLIPAETPASVVELVERCLVKDPRRRLRDIGDARLVLERVLATRSASGRFPVASPRPVATAARPRPTQLLIALAALAGGLIGAFLAPRVTRHATPLRVLAVPMPAGSTIRNSLLTRDGRFVVVSLVPHGSGDPGGSLPRILLRPIGSSEFHILPQTLGAQTSALEADGRSILAAQPVPGTSQRRLVRVPLDGSTPPTPLADWGDSWNSMVGLPNGEALVMDGTTRLVHIPKSGGSPSAPVPIQVTGDVKVSQIELLPSRMPNGDPLVNVIAYDPRGWHLNVGILDPKTAHVTIVVEDGGNGWYWGRSNLLLFARGRSILAAPFDRTHLRLRGDPIAVWTGLRTSSTRPGFFRILDDGTLYHAPGGAEEGRALGVLDQSGTISPRPGERRTFDDTPVPSPDGRRFVCTVANGRGIDELWIGDIAGPGLQRLDTDPDADCSQPIWSPDGRRIAYKRQAQDARDGLYVQDVAGGAAHRILEPESTAVYRPQTWLHDGSALIATRQTPGRVWLVRVPATGTEVTGSMVRPLHETRANEPYARLSPDGHMLAFMSDGTGRQEIYLASVAADGSLGTPVQVSSTGAAQCQWAADGRSVFAVDLDGRIVEFPASLSAPAPVAPQVRHDLRQLNVGLWTPLPDRRFLVSLRSTDESDITTYALVEGWMDEVERIVRRAK